jgi:5-methylcytosine-specific restriction endonuclease McrBC regulatory subunit McrC
MTTKNKAKPAISRDDLMQMIEYRLNFRSNSELKHLLKLLEQEDPKKNRLTLIPHRKIKP